MHLLEKELFSKNNQKSTNFMKKIIAPAIALLLMTGYGFSQEYNADETSKNAHYNTSKFKQLKEEFMTPNKQHTASGAPGHEYTQQQVDYVMNLKLDDANQRLYGESSITYHNNSKDDLEYLWVQLDQNVRAADSKNRDAQSERVRARFTAEQFSKSYLEEKFQGGFNIDYVTDSQNQPVDFFVNETMMRVNLEKPLKSGETYEFNIKWWYNINNYRTQRGRSGWETLADGNRAYAIAQFFPRLCVYNNVEGWQNMQFTGRSEFALEFGDYNVSITTPADFVLNGTGVLQNPSEVLTKDQYQRYLKAQETYSDPIYIVTEEDTNRPTKNSKATKTWKLYAENVRDFAFATSKNYMWDGMAVDINGKKVMAYSLFPVEGKKLWEEHSTRVVANTLEVYSKHTFDYPYPHATSVNVQMGMEYPMICFNFGRSDENGNYSERTKRGMISVITHEVGHNYFPMIVNSDERQWTWMDEGIDSFVQILALNKYDPEMFPLSRYPKNIVSYMKGDQSRLSPIMSQGDNIFNFGSNAYAKPAAGLFILRQTIMGPELFDRAFKTYSQRWMFKHPTPEDFFRSMEDASAMDLDWFWRGWFYTTGNNDIGVKGVKKYYVSDKPTAEAKKTMERYGATAADLPPSLYLVSEDSEEFSEDLTSKKPEDYQLLSDYLDSNFSSKDRAKIKAPKYFYEIIFEKPGDLVMPIIVEIEYEDGSKERKKYPAQIWRKNDREVTKVFPTSKAIKKIMVDPDEQTADVDMTNNSWPQKQENKFEQFKKNQIKG